MTRTPRTLPAAAALLAGIGLTIAVTPPSYAVGGATVGLSGGTLLINDGVGGDNVMSVTVDPTTVWIRDLAVEPTPGAGCQLSQVLSKTVTCPRAGITALNVQLGGGNDNFGVVGLDVPAAIDGGPGNDGISGTAVADALFGGSGTDTVGYGNATAGVLAKPGTTGNGVPGENDSINADVENLQGSPFTDYLLGTSGPNQLEGMGGHDVLDGGLGADSLQGGPGIDAISYVGRSQPVTAYLGGGIGSSGEAGEGDTITGAETLIGGSGNDVLHGSVGPESLEGGPGDDLLDGHEFDDHLDGGPGADTLVGGAGMDCVMYDERTVPVVATIGAPTGNGEAGENDSIAVDVDCVVAGSGGSTLTGNANNNILIGGTGDDVMLGGAGGDTLDGGAGTDTVSYADHALPVRADLDGLRDDGAAGENDQIQPNIENLVGGTGTDQLTGSAAANLLDGGDGDDVLDGGLGADTVRGGPGLDTVSYAERTAPVEVDLDGVADDGEVDESDALSVDVENVIGGSAADRLTGSPGANVLLGGGGDDVLDGGLGADQLSGGAGVDTVTYAGRAGSVQADLDGVADDGEAGESDNVGTDVENLVGGSGADRLTGSAGTNSLSGGAGNDVLDGGLGADELSGGAGIDTVTYASRTTPLVVRINDAAGDGAKGEGDNVRTDVENLIGGRKRDKLLGSTAPNSLKGGKGADVLKGKGGKDRAVGGAGRDTCVAEKERTCEA